MTSEILNDWYLNCFLHEIGDIIDETMPIQFLMDNCSAHNDKLLQIQRPTTSQNPNVHDVRYYPRQRPDVLVDMEHILQRKCKAVAITGVPYSQEVVRLLAIHIYHKLVAYNIYNPRGQRKQQHLQLQEDIVHSVEHARLLTRYLANSTAKTEYHKSMRRERNVNGFRLPYKRCPRCFKCDINFSLHLYWHTLLDDKSKAKRKSGIPDDPDEIVDPSSEEDILMI